MKSLKAVKMDKVVMAIGLVAVIFGISAVVGLGLSMNADSGMTHLQHSAIALASVAASNEPVTQPISEIACVPEIAKETVVPEQSAKVSESVVSVASNLEPATLTTNPQTPATTTNDDEVVVKFKDNAGWSGMSYIDPTVASNSTTNNDVDRFVSDNGLTVAGYYRPQNSFVLKTKDGSSVSPKLNAIASNPIVANVQTKSAVNTSNTTLASLTSTSTQSAANTFSTSTQLTSSIDSTSTKAYATQSGDGLRMAATAANLAVTCTYYDDANNKFTVTPTAIPVASADGTTWTASGNPVTKPYYNFSFTIGAQIYEASGPMTSGNGSMSLTGALRWGSNPINFVTKYFRASDLTLTIDASGNISGSGDINLTDANNNPVGGKVHWDASGNTGATPKPPSPNPSPTPSPTTP